MIDWSNIRQLLFDREFRIARCHFPPNAAVHLLPGTAPETAAAVRPDNVSEVLTLEQQRRVLVDVGTAAWRLRRRLLAQDPNKSAPDTSKLHRYVEAVFDALQEAGIEIRDHTNEPFRTGLALDVIAFQPVPGFSREVVIETIKPSIFLGSRTLQMGKVIVGTPANEV